MSEELKPCPFCGGDEIQFVRHSTHHGSMCCFEGCSARGPAAYSVKSPDGEDFSDHSEAIAAWNTRASAPEMAEALELLAKFAEDLATADLDELAADGGVTVGMVFQQAARDVFGPRARAALAKARGDQ